VENKLLFSEKIILQSFAPIWTNNFTMFTIWHPLTTATNFKNIFFKVSQQFFPISDWKDLKYYWKYVFNLTTATC